MLPYYFIISYEHGLLLGSNWMLALI